MKIREALESDAEIIARIHTDSWRNTYKNALSSKYLLTNVPVERNEVWRDRFQNPKSNQFVLVAEVDEKVVGFVCIYAGENPEWDSYLDNLHVRESHQSQGIGKALLIEAMKWSNNAAPGVGMCLLVNQDNTKAQLFYKKLGARNAVDAVWNAPDGSVVPTYWFVWDSID